MESRTGGSEVYSYNNWAIRYSFFLKQSAQSLMGKKKSQDHFPLILKSASVSHILTSSLCIRPHSGAKGERNRRGGVRELLRSLYVPKNRVQGVKKNWGVSARIFPTSSPHSATVSWIELLYDNVRKFRTKDGAWFTFESGHVAMCWVR